MIKLVPVAALLLCASCNSLNAIERQQYKNLMAQGAETANEQSPTLAAVLNILPGFGDLYNGEWGAFALDFLFWPPSVVWAIPQGAVTAGNLNEKATISFYTVGPGQNQGLDPNFSPSAAPKLVSE